MGLSIFLKLCVRAPTFFYSTSDAVSPYTASSEAHLLMEGKTLGMLYFFTLTPAELHVNCAGRSILSRCRRLRVA